MRAMDVMYDVVVGAVIRRYLAKPVAFAAPPLEPRWLKIVRGTPHYTGEEVPRIIWSYWDGPASPCVAACQRTWAEYGADYDIRILDKRSAMELLPEIRDLAEKLPAQQFSDLIRLMLMERFGGIWMDASIVLTAPINWVQEVRREQRVNFVGYYNESPREYRINHEMPLVENEFIATIPGDEFVGAWRQNYERCVRRTDYKKYYTERTDCNELSWILVDRSARALSYFSAYLAAQETFRTNVNRSMFLFNAADDFLYLHYQLYKPLRREKIAAEILMRPLAERGSSRVVKITGNKRKVIDRRIRAGAFRKDSLLGRYL